MNPLSKRILVVEDEEIIRISLVKLLERHQYETAQAVSVKAALNNFNLNEFDLIISDLRLPGGSGAELIGAVGSVPVLIMTSFASLKSAVDIMRRGAADYMSKPFDHEELMSSVKRIIDHESSRKASTNTSQGPLVGNSTATIGILNTISKVAPTRAPVLISGEIGSGKNSVAKTIHNASNLSNSVLAVINCATATAEDLDQCLDLADEKDQATSVFLRDICQLPITLSNHVLILTKNANIRCLASTTKNLHDLCKKDLFCTDLLLSIDVVNIHVPALRERPLDIIQLTDCFLTQFSDELNITITISKDGRQLLSQHNWPGNIRELKNTLYQAAILVEKGESISSSILNINSQSTNSVKKPHLTLSGTTATGNDALSLTSYFTQFVLDNQDTMSETVLAEKLGISRKSLWQRRNKLGISRKTD